MPDSDKGTWMSMPYIRVCNPWKNLRISPRKYECVLEAGRILPVKHLWLEVLRAMERMCLSVSRKSVSNI